MDPIGSLFHLQVCIHILCLVIVGVSTWHFLLWVMRPRLVKEFALWALLWLLTNAALGCMWVLSQPHRKFGWSEDIGSIIATTGMICLPMILAGLFKKRD